MGLFSIEKKAMHAAHTAPQETTDAWSGGWPQTPQEFGRLADVYLEPLVRYACRRLGSMHDAEDVVQDVFVRAFVTREKHRDVSQVGAYLYRMTANACTDVQRKRKDRQECVPLMVLHGGDAAPLKEGPSEALRAKEGARRAEQLLHHLPDEQAEAIRLRVFGDLDLNEIGEITGCSANTVSSRLRYGFRKLRSIVTREWKP